MPTYGYECESCKHTFDVFQSIKDEPLKTCSKCGKAVRRLINGGTGIIFKGNGFYVTDKTGSKPKDSSKENVNTEKSAACQSCPMSSGNTDGCAKAVNS